MTLLAALVTIHLWYGKMSQAPGPTAGATAANSCFHTVRQGTAEGELVFANLTYDNCLDAVMLQNCRSFNHYISMCASGDNYRKEGTIIRAKGSIQLKAGDNLGNQPTQGGSPASFVPGTSPRSKGTPAIYVNAVNGDIILDAPSGKIKMLAEDISLTARGCNTETGNIKLDANEKIIIKAKDSIDLNAKVSCKIFSEKSVEVVGQSLCNIFGGMVDFADGATSIKGSKGHSSWEGKMREMGGIPAASVISDHCG